MQKLQVTFVSNYINHHQIPFCNAMNELLAGGFTFVQTEKMDDERVRMGWDEKERPFFVKCFYEEEQACRRLIADSDVVLFGGTDDEGYIVDRLQAGKPVIRISERLYKTGQWKAISPRGLHKKYLDHTRYRKSPVYLLCAGAYVASDFHIVRAYPGKMYAWGYFPETRHYDVDKLLNNKGYGVDKSPYILWAGRMIDWKHPELALETAKHLKEKGLSFHLDMIGGGELSRHMEELLEEYGIGDCVSFLGFKRPEEVRGYMEQADIFLFTSDRQEGWGAVANEAMNSGCAVVADHMIGAVPYLVENGENGLIYESGKAEQLFAHVERLVADREKCRKLGQNAYETIVQTWNAENAAKSLLELMRGLLGNVETPVSGSQSVNAALDGKNTVCGPQKPIPCAPAPVLSEQRAKKLCTQTYY